MNKGPGQITIISVLFFLFLFFMARGTKKKKVPSSANECVLNGRMVLSQIVVQRISMNTAS